MTKVIFDKKNALVVGGAGFIGSHLCDELVKDSKVICIDNFSTGAEKNIDHLLSDPNFVFINHDITEPVDLKSFGELQKFKIEFQGIQEIYNLACPTSPKNFTTNRLPTILANSYGVRNIMDIAKEFNAKILHFSSSVVYGYNRDQNIKVAEEDLGQVDTMSERACYDEGKRFAETIVSTMAEVNGIDAKIIRLFRVYGPRMPLKDQQMLPDFVDAALDGKDLVIHGKEDFSSTFCYVSDCVDAAIKLINSDIKHPINVGSDIPVKLADVANKIIVMVNSSSKVKFNEEILFMKPLCTPDIDKARNELGWMPVITLEKGLELTIDELRASKGLVSVKQAI